MSDLFELKYPSILNPLNPSDRDLDPDQDGRSNLAEFAANTNPTVADRTLTQVETSPLNGVSGISVTRETIFRFSQPLAANTSLSADLVYAEVGSRRILSRVELASDRRKITLFYLEPLPASARIRARLDGNRLRDEGGSLVDGDGDGLPGGWTELQFDTMSSVLLTGTAVSGYVYDSAVSQTPNGPTNKPLSGVIITIDGNEQIGRAVTDSKGFFLLNPSPAGRFFVHLDGRVAAGSSWPDGAYYPVVGKTFEGTVGQTNPVPGGVVYLPLVPASTLKTVSAQTTTTVEFPASVLAGRPELAGVKVMVPPNALFADDGNRGGRVGIAPVPPDRIPSPLPPGLEPPIVITVQTDGPSNFDQPVPVQFPNLPDLRTGKVLAPGEKSVLWSFNHDSGQWEPQGTMTVSADGKFLVSDPGVGILQPGWHGANAVGQPTPPPNSCKGNNLTAEYIEWQLKAGECMLRMAGNLAGGSALKAGVGLAGAIPGIAQSFVDLRNGIQSGSSATTLGGTFEAITAVKTAMIPLASKFSSATPVAKLLGDLADLTKCLLEMADEQLDFSCQIVPCVLGINHPRVAQQQAICDGTQTAINAMLNAAKAYSFKSGGSFTRLCTVVEQMGPLLVSIGASPAGPSAQGPGLAAVPLPDQILAKIQEALAEISELQKELQPTVDLANQGDALLNLYSNSVTSLDGSMLLRLNDHANSYYKLTAGALQPEGERRPPVLWNCR